MKPQKRQKDKKIMYVCKGCGINGPSYERDEVVHVPPNNHFLCRSHARASAQDLEAEALRLRREAATCAIRLNTKG